jgi:hypothetical protein
MPDEDPVLHFHHRFRAQLILAHLFPVEMEARVCRHVDAVVYHRGYFNDDPKATRVVGIVLGAVVPEAFVWFAVQDGTMGEGVAVVVHQGHFVVDHPYFELVSTTRALRLLLLLASAIAAVFVVAWD